MLDDEHSLSRLPREHSHRKALVLAIGISVLAHVLFLPPIGSLMPTDETLEPTNFESDRAFKLTVTEEDEEEQDEQVGEFVAMPPPDQEERPDEARFRDQFDSKVDQEMVRKALPGETGQGANGPDQGPSPGESPMASRQTPTPRPQPTRPSPPTEPRVAPQPTEAPEAPTEDAPSEPSEATEETDAEPSEDAVDLGEAETAEEGVVKKPSKGEVNPRELFPSMDNAPSMAGGGGVDYLRNVDEGDKTLLNRKKSRYWSFMQRVEQQVEQEWAPHEEYRRRDPHGKVYGVKDRYTNLHITLNGDGTLRKLFVSKPSGLDFYDDEAVRAVRAAAPFPNPPEGLKDANGLIHFSFGFYFAINSGAGRSIKIRRF